MAKGISGAALGNRPGVLRLQEAALARRIEVILVTDLSRLSRLSRSNGDRSKLIDRLVAKDIRIVGVQDGCDSSRKGHKLMSGISGVMAEQYRLMIRDRTYAALESRAKEGRSTGGRSYGYRAHGVHADEARIVCEVLERFASGERCGGIATDLNCRGVSSPGSTWKRMQRRVAGWAGSSVRVMVRNERYRGVVRWNVNEWKK